MTSTSPIASKADKNLPERLAHILNLLHQGLEIDKHNIAQCFGTTVRTIERDLADRLAKLIEKAPDGRWQLRVESRAVVPIGYLNHYARLTDTENLLPDNSLTSLLPNLKALQESSLRVLGESYEDLRSKSRDFAALDSAIQTHQVCHFSYKEQMRSVKPYRLLNSKVAFPQISRQIMMSKLKWRNANETNEIFPRVQRRGRQTSHRQRTLCCRRSQAAWDC